MKNSKIYLGKNEINMIQSDVSGQIVEIENATF